MTRTFVLTVRDCPKSVNAGGGGSRSHWSKAYAEKKRFEGLFLQQLMLERVPTGMTHCNASITVRWKRRNHRDKTNYYHPIVKPLADVLAPPPNRHAMRWLPDDTQDYFQATLNDFEYPDEWPEAALYVVEMVVQLECEYGAP